MAPVFIVLFKLGTQMEMATIVFGTVVADPAEHDRRGGAPSIRFSLETARAFRMDARWQRVAWLIVPAALPKARSAGFRHSLSLSLILMVFAELVRQHRRHGWLRDEQRDQLFRP